MNNDYKIDSITSIIKDRPLDNIHYLDKSGIYTYGNINFIVNSLLDGKFYN